MDSVVKTKTSETYSPKNVTLDTNGEPYTEQEENKPQNVKEHITYVEKLISEVKDEQVSSKRSIDQLKHEKKMMAEFVDKSIDDLRNFALPNASMHVQELSISINQQKDENAKLQALITEMRKENSQMQQLLILCGKKLAQLEESVGSYGPKSKNKSG